MNQFQTWLDASGNLFMVGGSLIDLSASPTAIHNLIFTDAAPALPDSVSPLSGIVRRVVIPQGNTISLGGSGTNVNMSGTLSGTNAPIGQFRQVAEDLWEDLNTTQIIFDTGTGAATLEDATDIIANLPSGATSAPYGTFSSTTYGETTYNGGTPFTLTAAFEGRIQYPAMSVVLTGGTAQDGLYSSTLWNEWISDITAAWYIEVDPSGSALISDGTDDVATRASGTDGDGTGVYTSTAYGATTYNADEPFSMLASLQPTPAPIAGYVYVSVNLTAGVVTSITGPTFAVSLPSNSSTVVHVPIAHSDGSEIYQLQQGPILWK